MDSEPTVESMRPRNINSGEQQKNQQLIRSALRQVNDPVIGIDSDLKIVHVNEAAEVLFGYPEHDLLDRTLDILQADSPTDHIQEEIRQTIRSKRIWASPLKSRRNNGSTFIGNYTILPFLDNGGDLSGGICIIRDMTQDKSAHQALLESEERVALALMGADLGLWDYYLQTGELVADERFKAIWHCSRESAPLDLETLDNCIHPDDMAKIIEARSAHIEGKTPMFEATFRAQTNSGNRIWVLSKGKITQWDENGNPARVTGTCQDITRQKQAEESLRESEEVLRATFNAIDSGILVVDNDGNVSQMNRQFGELWRIPADVLETRDNQKMIEFVLNQLEEPDSFLSIIKELYNSTHENLEEIRFKDGLVYEHFSSPLIRDGKLRGRIFNFRDITERRQGEEERKRLESQLTQAQKMEAVGTLAGGIAHDFNNILSIILGYGELAMDNIVQPSKAKSYLGEVLKAGNRAKDLISHILTFSRQKETHHVPLEIRPIIKETVKMLRSVIPTTIAIRQNLIDSGQILSDPTQIHQVLMNLCTNAAHAMDKTGGVLEVGLEKAFVDGGAGAPDLPSGPYIRLTVSDTGHGISPEIMGRIFEPYFTTKGIGRGTGLGLSVVHGIVKNHGGSILCRSIPGKGTTFDIYLPEIEIEEQTWKSPEKDPLPRGIERILFVDDEPALVDLAKKSIESLGYTVVIRTSSIEALELFRNDPGRFDLVITDMTMPGVTGDKLARSLMEIRHDIPVIMCTGYSECVTEERVKEIGIRELILKPLLRKDLAKAIRRVLDERKSSPCTTADG